MRLFYLIPLMFVAFACNCKKNSIQNKVTESLLFRTLLTSQNQGRDVQSNIVVNNQKDLDLLFKSVGNDDSPKVDFDKHQVVALFLGVRNTGGYSISVDRVEEVDNKIVVYSHVENPDGGMVTMAITNPFVIAEINSKKEIIFK